MGVEIDIIKKYHSFFQEENGIIVTHPEFDTLGFNIQIQYYAGEQKYRPHIDFFKFIGSDIWNLKSIIFKLNYLNQLRLQRKIDPVLWFQMGSTDIEFFFTEIRSIFDYLSMLISHFSPFDIKQIKGNGESFRQLYQWLEKTPQVHNKFGQEYVDLILNCDWFCEIRRIRDAIRHKGSNTLIVNFSNNITFQIFYPGYNPQIDISEIMANKNIVIFEFCAIYYLARLNDFLEKLCRTVYDLNNIPQHIGLITENHTGNYIIKNWSKQFIEHLESL